MEPLVICIICLENSVASSFPEFLEPWLKPRRSWLNMAWTRGFVATSGFVTAFQVRIYGKVEVQVFRSHKSYEIGRRY